MRSDKPPVFLERRVYVQRRLRDATRLLPVVAVLLWSVPLLWPRGPDHGTSSAQAVLYFFGVWVCLILAAALLSRRLGPEEETRGEDGQS